MKIGLYIALICGFISGATIFFNVPLFPSYIFPVIIGLIGIIATLWTLPNPEMSGMLKLGGIMVNVFPVIVGIVTLIQSLH
ncbi:hypothetical protein BU586_07525 [Staphylococcus agnetis]|uniref:Uncharacterized protein n=1 Tax=Staphylococcus agnetis TaxID=985762 RepID=A0ABX3Z4P2_9STAP|nr:MULTISPECIES: hypothetical protein [Staphylococcus]ALN77024.1 hypothetical protein EP23_06505 [Staphylococcus agnetis]MCO4326201.1 hypothetical protein [Staphylococcus agnetis]MCO4357037.1 hypothetical protein [Staphylococcus agnetis]MCO4362159.1 hypothetical protein [Staphylococcus agnetis]MCO4370331.1 hypothetical protein [Staphylococcus agnetis]